ncbi:MAG: hypothetical protein ACQSGP_07365 [Frankia sp.]
MTRLRRRMESERIPKGVDRTLHVKFGPGGLTDVEWAVQVLQLRYARRIPQLRTTATVPALRTAAEIGLLDMGEASALITAWTDAARIRNAIMLATGRPGDVIPTADRPLARIAALLNRPDEPPGELIIAHRRTGARARAVVEALFARESAGDD